MKNGFKDWYENSGCSLLNTALTEFKGKGIGRVPLSNLIPEEFCGQENIEELVRTLTHDGLSVDEKRYSDGSLELSVFIK